MKLRIPLLNFRSSEKLAEKKLVRVSCLCAAHCGLMHACEGGFLTSFL